MVWKFAIGNELRITRNLYEIHRSQVRKQTAEGVAGTGEPGSSSYSSGKHLAVIDLNRTFPDTGEFKEGGPRHLECLELIQVYELYRPDIKYVQGMSFLIAMLLRHMETFDAFVGFCNLLNTPCILGLYSLDRKAVDSRADVFWRLCREVVPAVERKLDEMSMKSIFIDMFLMEWFMTLYAKSLPYEIAAVVWDMFLLDGEVVLYSAAVALLKLAAESISSDSCDDEESCLCNLRSSLKDTSSRELQFLQHLKEALQQPSLQLMEDIRKVEAMEFGPDTDNGANAPREHAVGSDTSADSAIQGKAASGSATAFRETIRRNLQKAQLPADRFFLPAKSAEASFPEPVVPLDVSTASSVTGNQPSAWSSY